jgi:molybdate transport system regulatory protein
MNSGARLQMAKLHGEIWLSGDASNNLARGQVNLLQSIERTGSITAAAKQLGISYKTAWERLDRLNNLAESPLVTKSTGGSQGGGTRLTPYGRQIVEGFCEVEREHEQFIDKLGTRLHHVDDLASFVKNNQLISSARNQFLGKVTAVVPGAVNAEIVLKISEQVSLVAIVTEQSREDLAIEVGTRLLALVKASSVLLSNSAELAVSARNQVQGQISRLSRGKVNSDVTFSLGDRKTLTAMVTNHSADQMELTEQKPVCAFFKASSVILLRA